MPPIYQPEVAARGVLYAADHPGRREYWVGASTAATIVANKFAPALLDRYLAKTGYDSQQTDQGGPDRGPGNLQRPDDARDGQDHGAHGIFDSRSHPRSAQLWAVTHPRVTGALAVAGVAAGAVLAGRAGRAMTGKAGPPGRAGSARRGARLLWRAAAGRAAPRADRVHARARPAPAPSAWSGCSALATCCRRR